MENIPTQAADWLLTDTTDAKRRAFDTKYGDGAADQIINEENTPEPIVESRSWGDVAWDVAADVGEGIVEAPVSIASGLYEGVIAQPASFLTSLVGDVLVYNPDNGEWFDYISPDQIKEDMKAGEHHLTDRNPLVGLGEDTFTGQLINDSSQFVGAFVGLGKVFKTGQLVMNSGRATQVAVAGAQTAGATFLGYGGNEGRITDMLLEMGVPDEMLPDFLETDPNDPEALGRLKNVVEEGPLGALGVFAVRAFRAMRNGDKAGFEKAMEEAGAAHEAIAARVDADLKATEGPSVSPEADPAPEAPVAAPDVPEGDLEVAQPAQKTYPEPTAGFSMTNRQNKRIETLGAQLAANPDASIKGDMGWRNHDHISAPEAVEAEIAATAKVLDAEFNKVKGNPQSEQLWRMQAGQRAKALAELTGVDNQKIIENVNKFDNSRTMAADLMARENYALSLSADITELAKAIRAFKDTGDLAGLTARGYKTVAEANLAIMQRRELAANVVASVQGARTNIARAMRAMQVVRSGDDKIINMLAKNPNLGKTADEIVAATLDGAEGGKKNLFERTTKASGKLGDAVNYYRINALLSGPGTQEVNFISNAINSLAIPTQQLVGGAASLNGKQVKHAMRTYQGMAGSVRESVVSALKAFYNDDAILDPFNGKIDTMDVSNAHRLNRATIGLPTRLLMGADEFFKQAQYRGRIFADAVAEANELGHKGAKRDAFVADYLSKSFDEYGGATRGEAMLQAQRATFTENLDPKGFGAKVQQTAIDHWWARLVVPFVKTPLNVLSQGFQHFPALGFLSKRLRDDVVAGGPRRAQAIGKQAIGAALTFTALSLAAQGRITGSGPKDPRVRAQWLRTNKPYSFVSRNADGSVEFTSYHRYEPFSYPLALAADMIEILQQRDSLSRMEAGELTAALVSAFAENTVNKTFTQGLADVFSLMTDTERSLENFLESFSGSFVPNAIPQMVDAEEKVVVEGIMDSLLSRLGMDGHLDRRRNVIGEVDLRHGSRMDPLGLVSDDIRAHDPVMAEMTRLAEVHQSGWGEPRSRYGSIDLREVEFSKEQSMFDRWMELQSEIEIGGLTLRERLAKTIKSRQYRAMSDGDRDFTGENEKHLKKIIQLYREKARVQLMRERPAFKDVFVEFEIHKRNLKRRSRTTSIQEILG